MIHELKINPDFFKAIISGEKTFEIRKNDRPFKKGDLLALNEWDWNTYTGNSCLVYIDYILTDTEYVKSGYAILGIKPCAVHRFGTAYNPVIVREDYSVPLATKGGVQE